MQKPEHVPTPAEIWKILRETSRNQQENSLQLKKSKQENAQLIKKMKKENDRRKEANDRLLTESEQKNNRLLAGLQKRLEQMIAENRAYTQKVDSRWGNQWGKLIEVLVEDSLLRLLNQIGIKVNKVKTNYEGTWNNQYQEYDLLALNGEEIVVVETKSKLTQKDVDDFLKKVKGFKKFCSEFKHLTLYAGVACFKGSKKVLNYAVEKGFLVIQVCGNDNANQTGFEQGATWDGFSTFTENKKCALSNKAILLNKKSFKPKIFN